MESDVAIEVNHVSKEFVLPHERTNSMKGAFLNIFDKSGKTYEKQQALKDISFTVKQGEFFGIVGRNGSGKSTLLKILAGIYQPTEGSVGTAGKIVPFIELGVGFNGELTGRENVYLNGALLGFTVKQINAKYENIVGFAELERFMDQKLKNYSSGMQVRLAFSVATILAESDILLIDEVLAVGDVSFQRKCFKYFKQLKKEKKTVVFVTHDMNAVREYCDRAVLIEKNEIVKIGHAEAVADAYAKMFAQEMLTANVNDESTSERWGDKELQYTSVSVSPRNPSESKEIIITATLKAVRQVEQPILGFFIKNAADTTLLGTNTSIKRLKTNHVSAGNKYTVTWTVPNIFGDGTYYIGVAAAHEDGVAVCDWWDNATSFEIIRQEKTPYIVGPSIGVTVESAK